MKQVLGSLDLVFLGIGGIIGAGVFVLTGVVAREDAGPAVVLSYILASLAAILSAFCYTEFAVDLPLAGGSLVFVNVVFGELAAWISATTLILDYTLGAAAVARSFTSYAGALIAGKPDLLRVATGSTYFQLDLPAFGIICVECAILALSTRSGARFNTVVTVANLAVIAFVFVAGLMHFDSGNLTPFVPLGVHGIFSGASKVFFSFLGFECLASAAEETRNPSRDLPVGIVASLIICASLYAGVCVVICGMVHWTRIDVDAPFAAAFDSVGMPWAGKLVAAGALAGILTSLLVTLYGQVRLWMTLGRERLLSARLAAVNPRTATPVVSSLVTALTAGACAALVDLEALAELVSIGALAVFYLVALACLWRRYVPHGSRPSAPVAACITAHLTMSAVLSVNYTARGPAWLTCACAGLWTLAVAALQRQQTVWVPKGFAVPLSPWVPALATLTNTFMITSLGVAAYVRFAVWLFLSLIVYGCYGVHHTLEDDSQTFEQELGLRCEVEGQGNDDQCSRLPVQAPGKSHRNGHGKAHAATEQPSYAASDQAVLQPASPVRRMQAENESMDEA